MALARPSDATDQRPAQHSEDTSGSLQTEARRLLGQLGASDAAQRQACQRSVDAVFGTPTITDSSTPAAAPARPEAAAAAGAAHTDIGAPGSQHPDTRTTAQVLADKAAGAAEFVGQAGLGAVDAARSLGSSIVTRVQGAASAVLHGAPGAAADVATGIEHAAALTIHDPFAAIRAGAGAVDRAATAVGTTVGAALRAIPDNPVQSALIAGAVAAEVATFGVATPLIAAVGMAGAAFTAHDLFAAGRNLNNDL